MLLLRTCLKSPAGWETCCLRAHPTPMAQQEDPSLALQDSTRWVLWGDQPGLASGRASTPRPAAGEKTLASATPENVLLRSGERLRAAAGGWCQLHLVRLHPRPIISALRVSHQRWVLTLPQRRITNPLLEKAFSLSLVLCQISRFPLAL